jgi:CubicO group peptidase (beta-lactamase class C family)
MAEESSHKFPFVKIIFRADNRSGSRVITLSAGGYPMCRFAAAALALTLCSAGAAAPVGPQPGAATGDGEAAWSGFADGFFQASLPDQGVPGGAVILVAEGRTVLARSYGYADLQTKRAVTTEGTLFQVGSISKLFTWIALMQQVEVGKLDLDRNVNDYLDFKIPERFGNPITLRHLMTHTAGFDEAARDQISSEPPAPLETLVPSHLPQEIYRPGSVISYSNYGAELAGYVVQRISGTPFPAYVQQHILAPLGMKHSTFDEPLPREWTSSAARGYLPGQREPKTEYGSGPAGGFSGTAGDMGRFMQALLNDGCLGEVCILKPGTLAQMYQRQHSLGTQLRNGMGLGFWIRDQNGVEIRGQSGRLMGFQADLVLLPQRHAGYFIVSNGEGLNHASLRAQDDFLAAFIDRFYAPPPPIGTMPAESSAAEAAGTYLPTRWFHTGVVSAVSILHPAVVLARADGSLSVSSLLRSDGTPKRWVPIGHDLFAEDDRGTRLELFRGPSGKVTGFATDLVPVLQYERSSQWLKAGLPASAAALLVLVIAGACVPCGWALRQRYAAARSTTGRFFKLARAGAWLVVMALAGWGILIVAFLSDYTRMSVRASALLTALRLLTILATVAAGALIVDGLAAWWDPKRGLGRRLWAGAIALAAMLFVLLVYTFGWTTFSLMY